MGARGFYLSRPAGAVLSALLAALLLALSVLAALYGRCRPGPAPTAAPTAAPTPPPRGPWERARLPAQLRPRHYELELWPRLVPGRAPPARFGGRVAITARCLRATATVLLHGGRLGCQGAAVRGPLLPAAAAEPPAVPLDRWWQPRDTDFLVLELGEALRPGRLYLLQLNFSAALHRPGDLAGLFVNHYEDRGRSRVMIASQMEPSKARTAFPCFDEPAMKTTFNITIVHHPAFVALSNMPPLAKSEREDENGTTWTVTTFHTTPLMPTYLTAFVVCDFDYVSRTERGNEIRIWARKDLIAKGAADFALNISGPIFSFLEDLLNVSYPLSKTDMVALPDFGVSAMENWGLLIFDELLLLELPDAKFTGKKSIISLIVSHEIGHQWFGNLVTMNWWNDIWLNEGFASYFECVGANYILPSLQLDKLFYHNVLTHVFEVDNALLLRPVSMKEKVTETIQLNALFDAISYSKGASLVRMLSSFLTERLFIKALNSYLKTFSFLNVQQDDLWRHFQMAVDEQNEVLLPTSVKGIMDPWTCQHGLPIITLDVSTGTVKQEPFYTENPQNQSIPNNKNTWIVPISWIKNGTVQPLVWLNESSRVFPEMQTSDSEHDWVILNLDMTGYYRVNYDQLGWKKLALLLEKNPKAIPVIQRLQLLEDAFSLSRANYIEIETALELTKYLANEEDVVVWHSTLLFLLNSDSENIQKSYDLYPLLEKYILKRLAPVFHVFSGYVSENITAIQDDIFSLLSLQKVFEIACWLGLDDCLQLSKEFFTKWMNSPDKSKISFPISTPIFCYGIAMGNYRHWEFLWNMYTSDAMEEEQNLLLSALSCSREPWILNRYLHYSLNQSLIETNETNIIELVAATEVGWHIAKEFLLTNWKAVNERYGEDTSLQMLTQILGRHIHSNSQILELQRLFACILTEEQKTLTEEKLQIIRNANVNNEKRKSRLANWLKKNIAD
ncbi:aminopeptidase Q [Tachyglossus aculeatus]|uniref:aminopeptidase Q n=1 Tax=Tachyglossus aculeatus TaxID=9261 RepID=UPI0018F3B0F3|nr:aminopeptidase Q [Tachyglossus aculeatus]